MHIAGKGSGGENKVSINLLFLCWNRRRYSEICWQCLSLITVPVHIIVADNGSTDDTREWIDTLRDTGNVTIEKWLFPKNFGLFRVLNLFYHTMVQRNVEYCGWVYNDTAPAHGWVGSFKELLDAIPNAGMITPADSIYQGHNPTVNMNGHEVYVNSISYFSDGFGLVRTEIFRKRIEKGTYPYIGRNHPGLSLPHFLADITNDGWLLIGTARVDQTWASLIENHNPDEAYRRQEVLVKRKYAIDAKAYYEATTGKLTWTQDGVEKSWDDEPLESIGEPLSEDLVLRAALDHDVSESDISLLDEPTPNV